MEINQKLMDWVIGEKLCTCVPEGNNNNKPGKIRMVWDSAAKSNGLSLNNFISREPDIWYLVCCTRFQC